MDEEERRRRAIAALAAGHRPGDVCTEFERSREWLAKWQRRFAEGGPDALRGQSRAPKRQARQTEPAVVRAVLAARDRLGRRRAFKGTGADVVAWELEIAGSGRSPRCARSNGSSPAPGGPSGARLRRTSAAARRIPRRVPTGPATCSRRTWSGRATCGRRRGRCASTPSTPSTSAAAGSRPGRARTKAARASAAI